MQYQGKCDVPGCQADILPAKTQAQFNRNLGLHKRAAHGIAGMQTTPEGRKELRMIRGREKSGLAIETELTKEELTRIKKKEYQAQYRAARKAERSQKSKVESSNGATLRFICPECRAFIYTTKES